MRKGKPIILTTTQKELLRKTTNQRTIEADTVERSNIILTYARTGNKTKTVESLKSTWDKVNRWVNRWHENTAALNGLDQDYGVEKLTKQEYTEHVQTLLKDTQRPGAPRIITDSARNQIVALASQKPEDAGVPITHWSHEVLATTAVEKGIVESISSSHVGNFLKWGGVTTTQEQLLGASKH